MASPLLFSLVIFCFSQGASASILRGMHFELASEVSSSYTSPTYNLFFDPKQNKFVGVAPGLWEWMSTRAGFTYNITYVPYTSAAPWLNQVVGPNAKYDFAATLWSMNTLTLSQYTMTIPAISYGWMLAALRPKQKTVTFMQRLLTFKQPMSNAVWGCVLLCILLVGVLMWWIERHCKGEGDDFVAGDRASARHGIPLSIWMSFMQFTGAGGHTAHTIEGRVFSVVWTFVIMVLLAVYTANLAAFFTSTSGLQPAIKSLTDVAINGGPVCSSGSFAPAFVRSQIQNPIVRSPVPEFRQALLGVANGSCVAAVDKNIRYTLALAETATPPQFCDVAIVGQPIGYGYLAFLASRRVSPAVISALDVLIGEAYQNGVLRGLSDKYLGSVNALSAAEQTCEAQRGGSSSSSSGSSSGGSGRPAKRKGKATMVNTSGSPQVQLPQLLGLFALFAMACGASWLIHTLRRAEAVEKGVMRLSASFGHRGPDLHGVPAADTAGTDAEEEPAKQQQQQPGSEGSGRGTAAASPAELLLLLRKMQRSIDGIASSLELKQQQQMATGSGGGARLSSAPD